MSLNQILAISEAVSINDQRFVGQVVSRNQRMFTSEIITVVPVFQSSKRDFVM